eukprot:SAG31_NODE_23241_length_508_cov_0.882641_1_plen_56_part_10
MYVDVHSPCGKAHDGAITFIEKKLCEICNIKSRHFGLPSEGKARWCATCASTQQGA